MSLKFFAGNNIFRARTQALVNPVNCVGTMGKGLAKQFANRFPSILSPYRNACTTHALRPGTLQTLRVNHNTFPEYIINLPTKDHWCNPSTLAIVEAGIKALRAEIMTSQFISITVPPLGCGLGGLPVADVYHLFTKHLDHIDCNIQLIRPPLPSQESPTNHRAPISATT